MNYPVIDQKKTGKNIKKYVMKENLSINEVASRLGISSKSTLYKWIRGDALPSLDNLYALSIILHVSINDLLCTEQSDNELFLKSS